MPISRRELLTGAAAGAGGLVIGGVTGAVIGGGGDDNGGAGAATGLGGQADSVVKARSLKPEDVTRALKTFVPPGETTDEFFLFASGGHSGQILVIGVPSMRLLKVIAVFSPEPWQGHGYGADSSDLIIKAGTDSKNKPASAARGPLTWGDTHHPALSETKGEYDGRWIYINDRANGRIAMVDLRDFKTKQIIDVPNLDSSHGGVFCTPNSEYVHISTMSPTLLDPSKAANALDNFKDNFRGFSSFMAIDQKTGRMDLSRSFQIELPPYTQDLADSGKLVSDGWVFINSYNSEMATGGNLDGGKPIEVGASANDFDFLHIINWKKAETVAQSKSKVINGMRVIPLDVAVSEGILYLAPEPKSPHGVDVAPNGQYISVGGKLDPHVTIYSIDKITTAIKNSDFEKKDQYGIPVLKLDSVVAGRVEVGLGPLHTQYDNQGNAYTSLFLDSAVAKWSLGGDDPAGYKLLEKLPVQYNIGHLVCAEGDTTSPDGKYLIGMNKWALDRFAPVGPLLPQNFQLVDLTGEKMEVLSDMPIGIGEPHYTQGIRADRIKAWEVYPVGTNPLTMEKDPNATAKGAEKVSRTADGVEVWGTVTRSQFKPDNIRARKGDKVVLHLTNIETTPDATHGFSIPRYNVNVSLDPGEAVTIEFVADAVGTFAYYCTEFCSALHLEMQGWLIVS